MIGAIVQKRGDITRTLLGILLVAMLWTGCTGEQSTDDFRMTSNAYGNIGRTNDFAPAEGSVVTNVVATRYDSVGAGFLGPPIATASGQLVAVAMEGQLVSIAGDSLHWIYQCPEGEYPYPELASDSLGNIYLVATNGTVRSVSPEGQDRWSYRMWSDSLESRIIVPSYPLVGSRGIILGNSAGEIIASSWNGERQWSQTRGAGIVRSLAAHPEKGIVLGLSHNSYEQTDTLLLLDYDGTEQWAFPLEGLRIVTGPVVAGDRILVGVAKRSEDGGRIPSLISISLAGSKQWQQRLIAMPTGIAADRLGNAYVSAMSAGEDFSGGAVLSYDSTGAKRWETLFESGVPAPVTLGASQLYFVSRREGQTGIFTYAHDGTFLGFFSVSTVPDIHARPILSPYGNVLFAGLQEPVLLRNSAAGIFGIF